MKWWTTKQKKKIPTYLRGGIQLLFFLLFPAAFTTAFSGVKYIFTQIGQGNSIEFTAFVTVLVALCIYTFIFGRFFCGYACAFGTLGDAVHGLYLWICKKARKKPIQMKQGLKKPLSYLKYLVLAGIVVLCFFGVYGTLTGWSPWDVFSMLCAGNFRLGSYILGVILLLGIVVGMAFCERFFCRFLCPMGAVFSLLPVLPLFSMRRKKANCAKGCTACQRVCPADLSIPEEGSWEVQGDCFQCQKCVNICPKKNIQGDRWYWKGGTLWIPLVRAGILMILFILLGL